MSLEQPKFEITEFTSDQQLSVDFFSLQLAFAQKMSSLSQMDIRSSLFTYTSLYSRLGFPYPLDQTNKQWTEFVDAIASQQEKPEYFISDRYRKIYRPCVITYCFTYTYKKENGAIHIHFVNRDTSEKGPLHESRHDARKKELTALFAEVKNNHSQAQTVNSHSWLLNLDRYINLFPPAYRQNLEETPPEFNYMSLWGQFLTKEGKINKKLESVFMDRLYHANTVFDAVNAFPYRLLRTYSPINAAFSFFKIA